jgi:hypothetical protein
LRDDDDRHAKRVLAPAAPIALEREVAALRGQVADLEAEIASYTVVDRRALLRGLGGSLSVFTVLVVVVPPIAAIVGLLAALWHAFASVDLRLP